MAESNAIVLWVLGGAGSLLLYSAVKGKSPTSTLLGSLNVNNGAAAPIPNSPAPTSPVPYVGNNGSPQAVGYWKGPDKYGEQPLYSNTGMIVGTVPNQYGGSPGTYIMNQETYT